MTATVTVHNLAESLYQDIVANIVRQISVNSVSRFNALKNFTGESRENRQTFSQDPSKDIHGQDKTKLKSSETSRYFECGGCGRKIAGGRFASHINKCLDKERR